MGWGYGTMGIMKHGKARSRPPTGRREELADVTHTGEGRPVDHVWANVRVFLEGGTVKAACQLGGDRLAPHLSMLAGSTVVVGRDVRDGERWSALASRPDTVPFTDGSFDIVAIENLDKAGGSPERVLEEALRLSKPAGRVVVGTTSRRAAKFVRGKSAAGSGRMFASLPGPQRPAFLFDPSDPGPTRYFVRRMAFPYRPPGTSGFKARLRQLRNRAALAVPPRLALRATRGRLWIASPGAGSDSLYTHLTDLLRTSWSGMDLPGDPPERFSPLVVGHRKTATGIVTVLLFREGASEPIVAKLPRYGGSNPSLQREAVTLERVSETLTGGIRATVPRSLGIHTIDGTDVLLQTGVPGRHFAGDTASRRLRPDSLERDLRVMLSWCLEVQAASGRSVIVDDELIEAKLVPLAEEGLAALDGDARVAALLDRALDRARSLRGTPLRLVVAHGDFWAGNVFIEDGRVAGVVDWERATIDDLPVWDPVKVVSDAVYHLDRYRSLPRRGPAALPRWGELGPWSGIAEPHFAIGFRAAFVQRSWLSRLAMDVLIGAFAEGGIPLGWLPVAIPFHLVRQFVHPDASYRSVEGWGSVLRALAAHPETWADGFAGERGSGNRAPSPPPPASVTSGKRDRGHHEG